MSARSGRPRWSQIASSQPLRDLGADEQHHPIDQTPLAAPPQSAGSGAGHDLRHELEATIQSRQELGPGYDALLIERFLERLDHAIDDRLAARSAPTPAGEPVSLPAFTKEMVGAFALTLVFGVPLTAMGAEKAGFPGLLAIWLPIAAIWLGILGYLPRPRR